MATVIFGSEILSNGVLLLSLNRPNEYNSMTLEFWEQCPVVFGQANNNPEIRCIVLLAEGRHFSSGLDVIEFAPKLSVEGDVARIAFKYKNLIKAFNAIEECQKPVIVGIQGACIGGAIDMITACDIRYCTKNAKFSIKEVDIGLAADVGTLQRLPKIVGHTSWVNEICLTGRDVSAKEAYEKGLVNGIFDDQESMKTHLLSLADKIASKSPVAIAGIKKNLIFSRDHPVSLGLEYISTWNASMLQTKDLFGKTFANL